MREFTKVSPNIHGSEKWMALGKNYTAKLVYLYLITCPHGNSIGCFTLKDGYATDDLDMPLATYQDCMDTLSKVGLIAFNTATKTVLITKWLDHNGPSNPKHALGMCSVFEKSGTDGLFLQRFVEFSTLLRTKRMTAEPSIRNILDRLVERYPDRIETVPSLRLDLDKTETRQRLDVDERRERPRPSQCPPATLTGSGHVTVGVMGVDPGDLYAMISNLEKTKPPKPGGQSSNVNAILKTPMMRRPENIS